jgi:hypothetical protein
VEDLRHPQVIVDQSNLQRQAVRMDVSLVENTEIPLLRANSRSIKTLKKGFKTQSCYGKIAGERTPLLSPINAPIDENEVIGNENLAGSKDDHETHYLGKVWFLFMNSTIE